MFETIDSAEILYPAAATASGVRVWAYTGHGVQLPWFHVSLLIKDNRFGQVIFASSLSQVMQLKSSCGDEGSLEVMLVTPPYLNGTAQWKMEELREVWRTSDPPNTIYVVQGSRHYAEDGEGCLQLVSKQGYERIF